MDPKFEPVGELKVPSRRPADAPAPPPPAPAPMPVAPPPDERQKVDLDLDALRIRPEQSSLRESSGRRRPWGVLVVLLLLGAGGFYAWREGLLRLPQSARPVVRVDVARTVGVRERTRAGAFSAAGWIKLPRYHPVYVTPLIEGRVEELLVIEGDAVDEGQVIARLYARDYCAECEAAEAAVAAAEAAHRKMQAGYRTQEVAEARSTAERLEAELETAREVLTHSEELYPTGAIPLEELQRDQLRVKTLEADLEKAGHRLALLKEGYRKEDIALAAAELERAKARRDLAKQRLGYVEIRSPMAGVVLERLASKGQWLKPEDGTIVSLYNPTDLEASVDISQDDLGRVFVGQAVEVLTRAEPEKTYEGRVVLIEPKADLVKNTVPVRVKLAAETGDLLFPDMVVKARFLPPEEEGAGTDDDTEEEEPVLTIDENAVVWIGGSAYVLVVEGGKAKRRPVTVGDATGGRVPVASGLEPGERVVVSDPRAVPDGTDVEVEVPNS